MKVVDLLGNEIKVNDIVTHATKCTNSAYLRRSIVKSITRDRISKDTFDYTVALKSITVDKGHRWKWIENAYIKVPNETFVTFGSTSQSIYVSKDTPVDTIEFKGIRLGTLEQAYTSEEVEAIKKTSTKLNYE
jgi:hypothetical protein